MKLLTINNRFNLISILVFFILAGFVLFRLFRYQLKQELDEQLHVERIHVSNALQQIDSIGSAYRMLNDDLTIRQIPAQLEISPLLFDTLMFDNVEDDTIPLRVIRFSARTQLANYEILIKKSELENSDLVISIFISLTIVFGLIGLMMILVNNYFSRKLWNPFLKTISSMKALNINDRDSVFNGPQTSIREFRDLNDALEQMIEKIRSDYNRIKDFSENAAHEIHTPLAIISSKLESLLQGSELNQESALLIHQALENTRRLSKLNQALLLLTKIENRQFEEREEISFSEILKKHLDNYEEIIEQKKISVDFDNLENFIFRIHPALADSLVSNLLNNAIRHNQDHGSIHIILRKNGFTIMNTGEKPEVPVEVLFTRFKKGNKVSSNLGLGLSIVKEIVDTNRLGISYNFENDLHKITIESFSSQE